MCLLFGLFVTMPKTSALPIQPLQIETTSINKKWVTPKSTLAESAATPFALEVKPYTLTLPDIRDDIIFYGKNLRPDIKDQQTLFFVGLEGEEQIVSIEENRALYLRYQPASTLLECGTEGEQKVPLWGATHDCEKRGSYSFSKDNTPTALWVELKSVPHENQVQVTLSLMGEDRKKVTGNEELTSFRLMAKPLKSKASNQWEVGTQRVDSSLLVRQKARFVGKDIFLQMHGGADYAAYADLYRIDFLSSEKPYNCFVEEGDTLIWENEQWVVVKESHKTKNKTLLVVKKIDDRMMSFDLWNEMGNQTLSLNLMRLKDHYPVPNLSSEFHFIQAKTWAQFIVECRGKKMTLRPNDWLLLTAEGWQLIDTIQKVEDYVSGILQGPLFVVGKLKKEEGGQVLSGHLINTTRSTVTTVKLEQTNSPPPVGLKSGRAPIRKLETIHSEHYHNRGNYHDE